MKLKDQVSSIGPSKELKKLGIKQDSYFYWVEIGIEFEEYQLLSSKEVLPNIENCPTKNISSAFTVAELGEILTAKGLSLPFYNRTEKIWKSPFGANIIAETEANARAKMIIYYLK